MAIIEALKNDIDLMMVQLYNSGGMYGLTGTTLYYDGTADFIVSQTEAIIRGFTAKNSKGTYSGLPAYKVVVALPATSASAGSGYVSPAVASSAVKYLMGTGPKPGSYKLIQNGGYPTLAGMMTWSINEDKDNGYAFATNYASIFGSNNVNCTVSSKEISAEESFALYPNPAQSQITISSKENTNAMVNIYNLMGELLLQKSISQSNTNIDISSLSAGMYIVQIGTKTQKVIVE